MNRKIRRLMGRGGRKCLRLYSLQQRTRDWIGHNAWYGLSAAPNFEFFVLTIYTVTIYFAVGDVDVSNNASLASYL